MISGQLFGRWRLRDGRGYLIPMTPRRAAVGALDLYNPQTPRAAAVKSALTMWFRWGPAGRWLPPSMERADGAAALHDLGINRDLCEHLGKFFTGVRTHVAISLGTPGPHRKPVLLVLSDSGKPLAYVKVGTDAVTDDLIRHEVEMLRRLAGLTVRSYCVPRVLHVERWNARQVAVLSVPQGRTRPAPRRFGSRYADIIEDLTRVHLRWLTLRQSGTWAALRARVADLPLSDHRAILERGACRAEEWLGDRRLPFHLSHGDFAPWNIKRAPAAPFVYDWEYACLEGFPAQDLCHFLFQSRWLLDKHDVAAVFRAGLADRSIEFWLENYLERLGVEGLPPVFLWCCYCLTWTARTATMAPFQASTRAAVAALLDFLTLLEDHVRLNRGLGGQAGPAAGGRRS